MRFSRVVFSFALPGKSKSLRSQSARSKGALFPPPKTIGHIKTRGNPFRRCCWCCNVAAPAAAAVAMSVADRQRRRRQCFFIPPIHPSGQPGLEGFPQHMKSRRRAFGEFSWGRPAGHSPYAQQLRDHRSYHTPGIH